MQTAQKDYPSGKIKDKRMEENMITPDFPEARNSYHRARLNVLITEAWLSDYMRNFFDSFELTAQQYHIMRIVQRSEKPLSILQIRDRMLEKMCDASRLIDRLILKDLVNKKISKQDKRLVEVFLTEKGDKLLETINEKLEELDKPILANISEEDANVLSKLLIKMRGCNFQSEK